MKLSLIMITCAFMFLLHGDTDRENKANPWIEISVSDSTVRLDFNSIQDAVSYNIYSSTNPYGHFYYEGSSDSTSYTAPLLEDKKFYYYTGVSDTLKTDNKEITEKIELK